MPSSICDPGGHWFDPSIAHQHKRPFLKIRKGRLTTVLTTTVTYEPELALVAP